MLIYLPYKSMQNEAISMAIVRPEVKQMWSDLFGEKQMYDCACQMNKEEKTFTEEDVKILNGRGCCVGFVLVISECQIYPELEKNQQILRGYQKLRDALKKNEKISRDPDIIAFIKTVITYHKNHLNFVGPLVGLGKFDAAGYQMMCDDMNIGDRLIFGTEYYDKRDETHAIGVVRLSKEKYLLIDSSNEEENKVNYCRSKNGNIGEWIDEALQSGELTCIHYKLANGHLSEIEIPIKTKIIMKHVMSHSGNEEVLRKALLRICEQLKVSPKNASILLREPIEVKEKADAKNSKEIQLTAPMHGVWTEAIEPIKKLIEHLLEGYTKSQEKIKLLKKCDDLIKRSENILLIDPFNGALEKSDMLNKLFMLIGKICFQKRWGWSFQSDLGDKFFKFFKQNMFLRKREVIGCMRSAFGWLSNYDTLADYISIEEGGHAFFSKNNFKILTDEISRLERSIPFEENSIKHKKSLAGF
jgi:hypothetical protein